MTSCPKCHYLRQASDGHLHPGICPACGIAYAKWQARSRQETDPYIEEGSAPRWRDYFMAVPDRVDPVEFWGRVVAWCALVAWGLYFAWHGVDWEIIGGSFLHSINLAFHEFGHVLFLPFGEFMTILGGSLFQVMLPFGLVFAFSLYQQDNFGASVMLWWCGQSFVDVAPYIRDGMYRSLPLVGGAGEESHDWGNLLRMMNAVENAPFYGNVSFGVGCFIMLAGLAWGAGILSKQYDAMRV